MFFTSHHSNVISVSLVSGVVCSHSALTPVRLLLSSEEISQLLLENLELFPSFQDFLPGSSRMMMGPVKLLSNTSAASTDPWASPGHLAELWSPSALPGAYPQQHMSDMMSTFIAFISKRLHTCSMMISIISAPGCVVYVCCFIASVWQCCYC